MNNIKTLFKKLLANLGTGASIALGMILTFAVVSAFQGPGGNPSSPGFQSGGAPIMTMMTKSAGTFDRETMSLEALRLLIIAAAGKLDAIMDGGLGGYDGATMSLKAIAAKVSSITATHESGKIWGGGGPSTGGTWGVAKDTGACPTGYVKQVIGAVQPGFAEWICIKT